MNESPRSSGPDSKITRRIFLEGGAALPLSGGLLLGNPDQAEAAPNLAERVTARRTPLQRSFAEQLRADQPVQFDETTAVAVRATWANEYGKRSNLKHLESAFKRMEPHMPKMLQAFTEEGVPHRYLNICIVETWFRDLTSEANAVGPFQFLVDTGRRYGLAIRGSDTKYTVVQNDSPASIAQKFHISPAQLIAKNPWSEDEPYARGRILNIPPVDERKDPVASARATARYLKALNSLYAKRGAAEQDAWRLAVSTYNGSFAHTYAKEVKGFSSDRELSDEERDAIAEVKKKL